MLVQRRRWWANIKLAFVQRPVFAAQVLIILRHLKHGRLLGLVIVPSARLSFSRPQACGREKPSLAVGKIGLVCPRIILRHLALVT